MRRLRLLTLSLALACSPARRPPAQSDEVAPSQENTPAKVAEGTEEPTTGSAPNAHDNFESIAKEMGAAYSLFLSTKESDAPPALTRTAEEAKLMPEADVVAILKDRDLAAFALGLKEDGTPSKEEAGSVRKSALIYTGSTLLGIAALGAATGYYGWKSAEAASKEVKALKQQFKYPSFDEPINFLHSIRRVMTHSQSDGWVQYTNPENKVSLEPRPDDFFSKVDVDKLSTSEKEAFRNVGILDEKGKLKENVSVNSIFNKLDGEQAQLDNARAKAKMAVWQKKSGTSVAVIAAAVGAGLLIYAHVSALPQDDGMELANTTKPSAILIRTLAELEGRLWELRRRETLTALVTLTIGPDMACRFRSSGAVISGGQPSTDFL